MSQQGAGEVPWQTHPSTQTGEEYDIIIPFGCCDRCPPPRSSSERYSRNRRSQEITKKNSKSFKSRGSWDSNAFQVQLVQASRSELLAVAQAVRFNTPEKVKLNSPVSAVLKSYFDNTLFVVFALSKIKANFRNKYQCLKINRCLLCACLQCLEDHSECASATGVFHPSTNVNSKKNHF